MKARGGQDVKLPRKWLKIKVLPGAGGCIA